MDISWPDADLGFEAPADWSLRTLFSNMFMRAPDAFQAQHHVETTPQTFIEGERIGGYDDLRRYFGKTVADPDATSYRPVIAVFSVTALMALAASQAANSAMFLGYDLLARRWVPYSYVYPFAEALAGVLMIAGVLPWLSIPVALFSPAGLRLADREPDDGCHGAVDGRRSARCHRRVHR